MANFQKFGKSSVGHLAAHFERWKVKDPVTGKEEYVKFGNQDIDISRTHLNYNLGPEREIGQVEFIQKRISEVRCLNRDDVKILCSCVVTLPRENEYGEKMEYTDDQIRNFFDEAYKQLRDQHGEENVVSCYVHMDETTPHMHFAFVPVVEDKKRGDLKVSAKEAINQTYLRRFHMDLQRSMDERFGVGFFPVLNGNTDGGNRTILQLKAERAAGELEVLEQKKFWTDMELKDAKKAVTTAKEKAASIYGKISAGEDMLRRMDRVAEGITEKKKNAKRDVESLQEQKTALEGDVRLLRAEKNQAEEEKSRLEKELPELREEVQEAKDELRTMEAAIKRKKDEGAVEFGSLEYFSAAIKDAREQEKKDQRMSLIEKFLELPFIKPLWEKFVLDQARGKTKNKTRNKGYGE